MHNPIKIDLGLLCQVVGRRVGVSVIEDPNATTFATNGSSVIIPTGIAGGEVDAAIMRGGIAHEAAGHVLHTDFDLLKEWVPTQPPIAKGLQNIIEDPRIEMAAIRKYPGCRKMLWNMVEALESRGFFRLPEADAHPAQILGAYLIRALRVDLLKQPLAIDEITKIATATFGEATLAKLFPIAKQGALGNSTADVLKATEAIIALLGDAANEPPPPPEKSQQKSSEGGADQAPGQPECGEGQGSASGENQPGAAGDTPSNSTAPSGQPGDPGNGRREAEAAAKALSSTDAEMGPTDLGEIIGKAAQGMGAGRGRSTRPIVTTDRRTPAPFQSTALASGLTTRLRSAMETLLQSRVDDEDPDREEVGRFDPRMLTRARLGDRRVFVTECEEAEGLSTAVHVVVDCSGSMECEGKADAALAVIYALSSAMAAYETQGVKFALTAFNTDLYRLKDFSDPWVKAKSWIGHYRASGGTRMAEAVRALLPALAARREKRKTMIVITDGDVGKLAENMQINRFASVESVDVDVLVIGGEQAPSGHGFRSVAQAASFDASAIQMAIFKMLKKAV